MMACTEDDGCEYRSDSQQGTIAKQTISCLPLAKLQSTVDTIFFLLLDSPAAQL